MVVVGYGGVQKAKTMTASAATVKMSELAKLPVASMSEGLGGRVTGVVTQQLPVRRVKRRIGFEAVKISCMSLTMS